MSELKATPGPWEAKEAACVVWSDRVGVVAHCGRAIILPPETQKANTYLIAAAPEMYRAIEQMIALVEDGRELRATGIGRTALAKARGER